MPNNSAMEMIAEDLISHFLQRNGVLVAKPKFDNEGGDLLAMLTVEDGARFCRIQSKGRSLFDKSTTRSITIPTSYVTESYVVMIYIDDGKFEKTHLYCCFSDDLRKEPWVEKDNGKRLLMSLTGANFEERLAPFSVTADTVERIKGIILHANVREEMLHLFDQQMLTLPKELETERKVEFVQSGPNWYPEITNPITGVTVRGSACPGNPDDYEYDQISECWRVKSP